MSKSAAQAPSFIREIKHRLMRRREDEVMRLTLGLSVFISLLHSVDATELNPGAGLKFTVPRSGIRKGGSERNAPLQCLKGDLNVMF